MCLALSQTEDDLALWRFGSFARTIIGCRRLARLIGASDRLGVLHRILPSGPRGSLLDDRLTGSASIRCRLAFLYQGGRDHRRRNAWRPTHRGSGALDAKPRASSKNLAR